MTRRGWINLVLGLSVTLNLLFIGFIAGQKLHGFAGPVSPFLHLPRWAETLPNERAEALRPILKKQFRNARQHMRAMRAQHRAVRAALAADPFDRAAFIESLDGFGEQAGEGFRFSRSALIEFVDNLDQAERLKLAADLDRRKPGRDGPRAEERHEQQKPRLP